MPAAPVSYRLGAAETGRRVLETTAERFPHHRLTGGNRTTIYYDTFDWRVFGAGYRLRVEFEGSSKVLFWLRRDGTVVQRSPVSEKPGFVWDLPQGALRDGLIDLLEMRRLLPLFSVEAHSETLHVLDRRRKTVARARLETVEVHSAQGQETTVPLPVVLRALPIRGYPKAFKALKEALDGTGIERIDDDEFTIATAAIGIEPGGYSKKLDLHLEPQAPSEEALKIIFRRLLEVIRDNESGLRSNLDSEFLHDFRVAVRRTRSALSQLRGVLPPATVAHFKTEFSWLGKITGPTRDLDVYLLKMPDYRSSLPEAMRADLDPLHEFLERHQQTEHRELVQLLDTPRYRQILVDWQAFLDSPLHDTSATSEAATPILDLASKRIWHSAKRVLKKGAAITEETPAEALHRLRIECKKLRYLLEFFRSLYSEKEMAPLINSLKRLQDNLGDFNDLEIQQATLQSFAQSMLTEQIGTASSVMAMGRLVERLEHRQAEERQVFHKQFARFSSRKNRQRLKTLFKLAETGNA